MHYSGISQTLLVRFGNEVHAFGVSNESLNLVGSFDGLHFDFSESGDFIFSTLRGIFLRRTDHLTVVLRDDSFFLALSLAYDKKRVLVGGNEYVSGPDLIREYTLITSHSSPT